MIEAEATFKADLEKLLRSEGHMPDDKLLVMSRKGKRLGVAFASTPRGERGPVFLKFKTKMSGSRYSAPAQVVARVVPLRTVNESLEASLAVAPSSSPLDPRRNGFVPAGPRRR